MAIGREFSCIVFPPREMANLKDLRYNSKDARRKHRQNQRRGTPIAARSERTLAYLYCGGIRFGREFGMERSREIADRLFLSFEREHPFCKIPVRNHYYAARRFHYGISPKVVIERGLRKRDQMSRLKIFDISRPIGRGEAVYPGNEAPALRRIKIFSKDKSNLSALSMGLHTASHLDAPFHYLKNGKTIDKLALEKCVGWCRVINFENVTQEIGEREVKKIKPKAGEIILFKTKNSELKKSKRFNKNFIHLNESGARFLVKSKIKAVGIDGPSIRKFRLKPDTVHPMLLRAGIGVYEGLYLRNVKPGRYFFIGLPLNIRGAEASPVRAVLVK